MNRRRMHAEAIGISWASGSARKSFQRSTSQSPLRQIARSIRHSPPQRLLCELNSTNSVMSSMSLLSLALPTADLPLRSALRAVPTTDRAPCTAPLCTARLAAPTVDRPPRIADLAPPTCFRLPRTADRSPCTVPLRPCSAQFAPCTVHRPPCTAQHALRPLHRRPYTAHLGLSACKCEPWR